MGATTEGHERKGIESNNLGEMQRSQTPNIARGREAIERPGSWQKWRIALHRASAFGAKEEGKEKDKSKEGEK